MKIAALDLGTNSFLCLIGRGDKNGLHEVIADHMEVVRLGQEVNQTRRFHPDALIRAKACLERFKVEINKHQVEKIHAVATSAARDVSNGEELFRIGKDLGIPISIIDGKDEARISYAGATWGHQSLDENLLVIDVGGGSTEYIVGRNGQILFGHSLNIGGVRLTEKYISKQPVTLSDKSAMMEFVATQVESILPMLTINKVDKALAVAGTPTALAAIEIGIFDEKKVDGYFISLDRLRHWQKEFEITTIEYKKEKYGLGGRADIIFAGISILIHSLEVLNLPGMYVSTKGVRYGVAQEICSGRIA